MAELIISSVSNGGIKANALSESFSGLHQIKIFPENGTEPQIVSIDGFSVIPSDRNGLECIQILPDLSIGVRDVFDFSIQTDVNRFDSWLTSLSDGIVLMKSKGTNTTNGTINAVFKKIGNIGWENHWNISNGTSASRYAAIYDTGLKKIMVEMLGVSSNIKISLETVFDTFNDIGVTGYGNALVYDQNEYISETPTTPEIVRYMNGSQSLSSIGVNTGETLRISLDMYRNDLAALAGESIRLYFIGYKGNTSVTSNFVEVSDTSGSWEYKYGEITIPSTIDNLRIYATAWPIKSSYQGTFGTRCISVYRKKKDVSKSGKGSFGQWGFITESAKETSGNIVGSFLEKNVTSFEYGNLEPVSFPHFTYGSGKYITLPTLVLGLKFTYLTSVVYSNTDITGVRNGSGTDDTFFIGSTSEKYTGGMGHILVFNGKTIFKEANVSCNKEYLYKMVVDNTNVDFYVDDILVGTTTITSSRIRTIDSILVGNEMDGYVISSDYQDMSDVNNSRYYNYSSSEKLDFVKGTSPGGGMSYSGSNIVPNGGSGWLYCGTGSNLIPAGMKEGSKAFVTIVKNNGATLHPNVKMNHRYEVTAFKNTNVGFLNQWHLTAFKAGSDNWITAGNMTQLEFDVDCITDPVLHGTKPVDLDWVKNRNYSFNFNGSSWVDIPPVYSVTNKGYITLKFIQYQSTTGYIIEGRSNNTQELQGGWVYIKSNNTINTSSNYKIVSINGKSPTASVGDVAVIENGIPYSLVIEMDLNSVVRRIGARYNGVNVLRGKIWDISISADKDLRQYKNIYESRLNSYSTGIVDLNGISKKVYDFVDFRKWKMSDSINNPINILSNNSFIFTKDVSEGGMSYHLNLPSRGKFRIEYDIESTKPVILKDVYGTSVGVGESMKLLPSGRYKGILISDHVATNYDSGIYICVPNARIGDTVILRSLVAYVTNTDGIGSNVQSDSYSFDEFYEPQMISNNMSAWVPNLTGKYMNILPSWIPNETGYRIRFAGKSFSQGELLNSSDVANAIKLTVSNTTLNFNIRNANNQIVNLNLTHGISLGSPFDIVVDYVYPNITIKANSATTSTNYTHIYGSLSDRCGVNFTGQIDTIELTEISLTRDDSRRYELVKTGFVEPIQNTITNSLVYRKKLRTALLPSGIIGWDNSYGDVASNGRLKDDLYIHNYKLIKIIEALPSNGIIIQFEGNVTPFDEIEIVFMGTVPLKVFASKGNGNYVVQKSQELEDWMKPTSYKVISFRPIGVGLNITSPVWKPAIY
ncbi:long-tail fiber protein [Aeromonas phage avDM6]|nr:long-tail fiber protein [Aeromonas phage avDM6]